MFSRHASPLLPASLLAVLCASFLPAGRADADFQITPPAVTLDGNFARAQLVVTQRETSGSINERTADLTHNARYVSSDPHIVTVSDAGLLLAKSDGSATVTVHLDGVSHPVAVTVKGVVARPAPGNWPSR